MMMVALTPCSLEASAIACAWLPDENVTTPAARCSGVRRAMALKPPRNLNAPMRWKFSHLKNSEAPAMASAVVEVSTGVRCAWPARRSLARATSSKVGSSGNMETVL